MISQRKKERKQEIMENNTFTYQYSSARNREIESIRKRYLPKEENKLERLKELDRKVKSAGMIESLCFGVIGVLVFGIAMCFGLGVFNTMMWPAIPFGIIGIMLMLPAYPLYKYLHNKRKNELAPEILRLSEEIIEN